MLKTADCPICQKEIKFSSEVETVQIGCPACGRSMVSYICPYCNSEFTSADIGETSECLAQD